MEAFESESNQRVFPLVSSHALAARVRKEKIKPMKPRGKPTGLTLIKRALLTSGKTLSDKEKTL